MRTLSPEERRELLRSTGVRRVRQHDLGGRVLHWRYCRHCRVIRLNNEVTRRYFRRPCVTYE